MVTSLTEITSPRFNALSKELQGIIDEEKTGGISCLVYHKGEVVYRKTFGWLDRLNQERMGVDTIHRIYSMTKPIGSFKSRTNGCGYDSSNLFHDKTNSLCCALNSL
ncbi:MAG: serine hydrolase [Candidatus Hodarchaeales archaeon]|jgi:CubicO group peptidase (beta-lactamase class C family)